MGYTPALLRDLRQGSTGDSGADEAMKKNWVTFVGALSLSALALGGCKSGDNGPEQPAEDDSMKEPAAGDTKTGEEKCSGGDSDGAGK